MLFAAARDLNLDLARSAMFGDRASDLEAARAAGIQQRFLIATHAQRAPDSENVASELSLAIYPDLLAAVSSQPFQQFAQMSMSEEPA